MTSKSYEAFDVVVVPFPFADRSSAKRRPALVLSRSEHFQAKVGHSVLAMITSAENPSWPLDIDIEDLDAAGLVFPSKIRMKIFTLDDSLILRKSGVLGKADQRKFASALRQLLPS